MASKRRLTRQKLKQLEKKRAHSCLAKHCYPTADEASAAAAQKSRDFDEPIVAYRCRWCGHFHCGHPRWWVDKRRRDRALGA